jgi:hypothetical protein
VPKVSASFQHHPDKIKKDYQCNLTHAKKISVLGGLIAFTLQNDGSDHLRSSLVLPSLILPKRLDSLEYVGLQNS